MASFANPVISESINFMFFLQWKLSSLGIHRHQLPASSPLSSGAATNWGISPFTHFPTCQLGVRKAADVGVNCSRLHPAFVSWAFCSPPGVLIQQHPTWLVNKQWEGWALLSKGWDDGELSIESSYEDIKSVILQYGFCTEVEKESVLSAYTVNVLSMMKYYCECVLFLVRKSE